MSDRMLRHVAALHGMPVPGEADHRCRASAVVYRQDGVLVRETRVACRLPAHGPEVPHEAMVDGRLWQFPVTT